MGGMDEDELGGDRAEGHLLFLGKSLSGLEVFFNTAKGAAVKGRGSEFGDRRPMGCGGIALMLSEAIAGIMAV